VNVELQKLYGMLLAKDSRCFLDFGATVSICFSRNAFVSGTLHVYDPRPIVLADTSEISARRSGDVILDFSLDYGSPAVVLRITGCIYVDDPQQNFTSVGKLADKGITSIISGRDGGT
jgi:hypothetical protein